MTFDLQLAPFEVKSYATTIVDFKFMRAIDKGEVNPLGEWICGVRPRAYCDKFPNFFMRCT